MLFLSLLILFCTWSSFGSSAPCDSEIVSCIPFDKCPECTHNRRRIDVIKCQMPESGEIIYCYPFKINFSFKQTEPIRCRKIAEKDAIKKAVGSTITCTPTSACKHCGHNDEGIDAIRCKHPAFDEVTCYPKTIDFSFGKSDSIQCTVVVL